MIDLIDLREEAQSAYRKIIAGDAWHFNTHCSKWPTADYVELEILPSVGAFCDECKAKHSIANPIRPLPLHSEPLSNGG
jgi:hypothetical protein